jgi:glycosyltransferase involved in cell wall biosynthesis
MVHEPYLGFGEGSWKQTGVAVVHRLMTAVLMKTASRVWMSIPAWEGRLRPYAFGRELEFSWSPIPSSIPVVDDPAGVQAIREHYAPAGEPLVGHFGAYDRNTTELLLRSMPELLRSSPACRLLLLGHGSQQMYAKLIAAQINSPPGLAERVHATGTMAAKDVSLHLSACDVLLQPFIDGVSSRRGSVMAGLVHGVPIVTNNGRLTEPLWAESGAVALAPGADAEALVKATLELLSDETSRRPLGDAGRELYNEHFTIERTVAALRARDQRSEVRDRTSEVRGQRSEARGPEIGSER